MTQYLHSKRRAFLVGAGALSVVSAFGRPAAALVSAYEAVTRTGGSHLKTSLNAYSFVDPLSANMKDKTQGLDLFQLCDFCAQCNFDGVDLTGYFFPGYPDAPEDRYLFAVKRHAFDLGLGISGTGVRNDFTTADKAVRAAGVQRVKTWIEVAAKLGAPTVRAFADSQAPFKDWHEASGQASRDAVEAWMADALRECADHGEKHGVMVAVQNHGDFIRTGAEHLRLLERVGHRWCGALVDVGEYMTEDPYVDIAMMAPYAVNWQVKETLFSKPDGPRTDLKKVVKIARESGYRGYMPIETLAMGRKGYDSFVQVPLMLAELNAAIASTEPAARPAFRK